MGNRRIRRIFNDQQFYSVAILAVILAVFTLPTPVAQAATILVDPGGFSVSTTLIDFEKYPDGTTVPTPTGPGQEYIYAQWDELGVLVSDNSAGLPVAAYGGTFSQTPHSGVRALGIGPPSANRAMTFTFVLPNTTTPTTVSEAGIWVQNGDATTSPSTVEFFDSIGGLLGTITTPSNLGSNNDYFAGLQATEGIASLKISDTGYFLADDLEFASLVPIPATVWLFGSGLIGLFGIGRGR